MINPNEKKRIFTERRLCKIVLALLAVAVIVVVVDKRSDARWSEQGDLNKLTESELQTDGNAQRMKIDDMRRAGHC